LWSSTGTLLATGTFTGGTASGWQVLTFATPVAINANTTYIASTHGTTYYATANVFLNAGVDNASLHALKNGVDGPNAVFAYGGRNGFPESKLQCFELLGGTSYLLRRPQQSISAISAARKVQTIGTSFGAALQAKVVDGTSNPVVGVAVTFTVPAAGASATLNGATSFVVNTDDLGIATSPVPLANGANGQLQRDRIGVGYRHTGHVRFD
jgi:hypothetical protein